MIVILMWLGCIFSCTVHVRGDVVYVYPTAPQCGSLNITVAKENLTLNEALQNITSNTELRLYPGCHQVQQFSLVKNRSNISVIGIEESNVTITCANDIGLAFLDVSGLTITNVTIQSCGLSGSDLLAFYNDVIHTSDIDFFFELYYDYRIALLCGNCGDLTMSSSTVTNTTGLGMLAINAVGTASITDVEFSFNYPPKCYSQSEPSFNESAKVGGGAIFIYHDYLHTPSEPKQAVLDIKQSHFLGNFYCGLAVLTEIYYQYSDVQQEINYTLGAGGGLSIIVTQLNYTVSATVESCYFQNNIAKFGGGAQVQMFAGVSNSNATFVDCHFEKNGFLDFENFDYFNITSIRYTSASALAVLNDFIRPANAAPARFGTRVKSNTVTIFRCLFKGNKAIIGGAITVYSIYASPQQGGHLMLLIDQCTIDNNTALVGAGMYVIEKKHSGSQPGIEITMRDTNVAGNEVIKPAGFSVQSPVEVSSVIDLFSVNFTISNSTLSYNKGTAIRCVSSLLFLEDHVTFKNNAGVLGGALQMITASFLIIRNNTHVLFHNNSGSISGGAIYVDYLSSLSPLAFQNEDCFLYFGTIDFLCIGRASCSDVAKLTFQLDFIGNTAPSGSLVYGSTLETCFWGITLKEESKTNLTLFELLYDLFPKKFNFGSVPNNTSLVSTPSAKVAILGYNNSYSVLPGENFNISVVGVDRFGRVIPVVLTSQTSDTTTSRSMLGLSGYWLTNEQNNTNALITVYGKEQQQDINVTLYTAFTFAQTQITVNLMNCTLGFVYSNTSDSCECVYGLKYSPVYCSKSNKDLSVPNDVWVGPGPGGELVVEGCLEDFCRRGQKTIKPPDFDPQCHPRFNRTGLLCGTCNPGYSNGFGGNSCYQCANSSLVWIFFFALAGVGIVLAISFVRLTVSDGYLNGIILFANIVSLYVHIFAVGSRITQLFVVIAWLNLDLGIDTCFYDGMNALAKVGLDFAFPFYLYILMGVITLIGKKSQRFAMRFNRSGFSAAKLFATLMLMSYTSLLETCAQALGVVKVDTISGKFSIRWRADPTQVYFSGGHVPLAITAILVLVFFIIPVPFVLIFPSLAFKLGPMQRLKPIYDAFWAPFKPRYRFWVGLRLLLRGIPFLCVAAAPHPLNILLLGIFLVGLLYVQAIVMPFDGAVRNASDNFFLCILLIIVMGSLYFTLDTYQDDGYYSERNAQYVFFFIILFLAYVVIAVIFIWHVMLRFPSLRNWLRNLLNRCRSRSKASAIYRHLPTSTENYGATNQANANSKVTGDRSSGGSELASEEGVNRQVYFSELREPLLEDEGSLDLDTTMQVQSVQ